MSTFAIGEHDFLQDGRPVRLISGALHYFRVHPGHWRDRIVAARQMGLDTIETYIAWNEHAPRPGEFRMDDRIDFVRFLQIVQEEGMRAIVRPGPFICAEWDNGGLPGWLLKDPSVGIRRSEPQFMAAVTAYLHEVLERVAPLQVDRGGPVVLVQVENEYGAYGDDTAYLAELARVTRECGITVPLTTVDQPSGTMLADGSLPGAHLTASFGSRAPERLAELRRHQPTGPLFCSEFWCGWFDHWGSHHHTTSAAASSAELDALLGAGASVNIYMVHGGTSFGLTSGANDKGAYRPTVTSYDYDAPLDEAGRPTEKYWAFREVIARHTAVPDDVPPAATSPPVFEAPLLEVGPLLALSESVGAWQDHSRLPTFDDLDHYRGLVHYRTLLTGSADRPCLLSVGEVRDRAQVFLDGAPVGVLSRENHESSLVLPTARGVLTILVEDQGRVNYGDRLGEHKGLIGPAAVDGHPISSWQTLRVDHDGLPSLAEASSGADAERRSLQQRASAPLLGPVVARATFDLDTPADLFLDTAAWGKGMAWINGFPLGRYWRRGPQQTLFVPGPATRAADNELVVLELEVIAEPVASFVGDLRLGHTEL